MQCQMLLLNFETVLEDKRFLKSVSTGLDEFIGFNISEFVHNFYVIRFGRSQHQKKYHHRLPSHIRTSSTYTLS